MENCKYPCILPATHDPPVPFLQVLINYHPLHTGALVHLYLHINALTNSLDKYLLSTNYGPGTTGSEDKRVDMMDLVLPLKECLV